MPELSRNCLVCVVIWACCCGNALAGDAVDKAYDLNLKSVRRFASEHSASQQCEPQPVVWVDAGNGYYYTPGDPRSGAAASGAYTCLGDAIGANYWDINPFATPSDRGRSFPINPDLICPRCS